MAKEEVRIKKQVLSKRQERGTKNEVLSEQQIVSIVEAQIERVRPVMDAHGGGASIVSATPEQLVLRLEGHCADCAMAPMTFGLVLEQYIRQALPSVKEIRYTTSK